MEKVVPTFEALMKLVAELLKQGNWTVFAISIVFFAMLIVWRLKDIVETLKSVGLFV
jgi:hypothetical protein